MKFIRKKTLTRKYKHPFTIINKTIPIVEDREINRRVALHYTIKQFRNYTDFDEELAFDDTPKDLRNALEVYWKNNSSVDTTQIDKATLQSEQQKTGDKLYKEATRPSSKDENNERTTTSFSKEEEQYLWNRIYKKAMKTNRKLEQVESSEEFVEDSQEITTDIGYLNEITIENINYIFDTLHEDRFYLKPYQELEDLSKIKLHAC